MITGGVSVSDNAVREAYRKQGVKVKFDYAVVDGEEIKKSLNPSDSELESFFKNNAARYASAVPEARKLSYIAFDASNLPGGRPQISDADIQSYYNQHLAEYKVEAQVKVRHILIAVPQGADAKTDAAAKAKAESLQKQVKGGADFAKLARENSDDPGSKEKGGDLGMVRKGQMVPEFEKQSFSTAAGQTSDVFKTQFGYHFLQVTEKQDERTRPLAEVKDSIRPLLEQQKVGGAMQDFANKLSAEAAKQGLAATASAHGLKVQTTDYLGADGVIAGVPDGSSMLSKAFSVKKGDAPASVATGDGFAVFQVDDIRAAHAPAFADWKSHVADDFKSERAPQVVNAKLKQLADRAKVLNDLKKAAAEEKVTVKTSELVGATGTVPDIGSMSGPASVAFTLPQGGVSGPINLGPNGVVLVILDKQEPSAEEIAKNFTKTRDAMLNQQRQEVFAVYVTKRVEEYEKAGAIKLNKQAAAPVQP
nr:peptidyl-prolyl cis-trans isomerase [Terriglobus tenax]